MITPLAPWPAYNARERVLHDLEAAIAAKPEALDTRFYYASFLRDHGRFDEALATFEYILVIAPDHAETLVAYGVLLARRGRRLDARAVFERAVAANPAHRGARANLANALALDDPERARALYEALLATDAAFPPAHRGLCSLAAARGDAAAAAHHRALGYAGSPFGHTAYLGATMPLSVVALVSTDGGNIPLEALLDERVFLVHPLYVEAYAGQPFPPHALIVNAIADADRSASALARAADIARTARRPIVNAPERVARTGRVAGAAALARIDGAIVPAARALERNAPPPAHFPVIVRAPGYHMGRNMIRADDAAGFTRALAQFPLRDDLIAIPYVDTRSPDGAWRKYRVMAIGGTLYALHLAIAQRWDVHYFSSAMAEHEAYRREEARFLADPAAVLGERAWNALGNVRDTLALDYAGIDFVPVADGRIVVFEANAAMTMLRPDHDPHFAYRIPASTTAADALVQLFRSRAA